MSNFFEKNEYTEQDINTLIQDCAEETIYLEFKSSGAFGKTKEKRKEISKDVSAFANSAGGIIIYGLEEEDHVAKGKSFIDGSEYTKEWIENVISSNIQRRIPGVEIIPIRFNNNVKQTIYIVKIPESIYAPHMMKDKRYYKRHNFECSPMEEYEVRDIFNRKHIPDINLERIEPEVKKATDGKHLIKVQIRVNSNSKNSIYSTYKVKAIIHDLYPLFILEKANLVISETTDKYYEITHKEIQVLYPKESSIALDFLINTNVRNNIYYKDVKIKVELYYANKYDERYYVFDPNDEKFVENPNATSSCQSDT